MSRTYRRRKRYLEAKHIGHEHEQIYFHSDFERYGITDRTEMYRRQLIEFHSDTYVTKQDNPFGYIPNTRALQIRRAYRREIHRALAANPDDFTRPVIKNNEHHDWWRLKPNSNFNRKRASSLKYDWASDEISFPYGNSRT